MSATTQAGKCGGTMNTGSPSLRSAGALGPHIRLG